MHVGHTRDSDGDHGLTLATDSVAERVHHVEVLVGSVREGAVGVDVHRAMLRLRADAVDVGHARNQHVLATHLGLPSGSGRRKLAAFAVL